ncbi:hypothetical protein MBM_08668 [Drepanopeziza brunnea f. sp. 'multigermtubi' MB_m1]|uniref:Uncharacterized protein n=1 Tax=Marssonina brunnea f. sp. multigermtubi (strain MB_m1) TaxID=1072389 RepID=K1W7X7_MARBU|nr:uncharacterized protein MBM_08668 [Drepanopeziza brunnea f. sp. 'multigermtubi' MB_m1]EKD13225.1 hypothetical protein MBM_08668 [Drepanopeziza brunnea f. sp. 'multigermtubi' MB_m1]
MTEEQEPTEIRLETYQKLRYLRSRRYLDSKKLLRAIKTDSNIINDIGLLLKVAQRPAGLLLLGNPRILNSSRTLHHCADHPHLPLHNQNQAWVTVTFRELQYEASSNIEPRNCLVSYYLLGFNCWIDRSDSNRRQPIKPPPYPDIGARGMLFGDCILVPSRGNVENEVRWQLQVRVVLEFEIVITPSEAFSSHYFKYYLLEFLTECRFRLRDCPSNDIYCLLDHASIYMRLELQGEIHRSLQQEVPWAQTAATLEIFKPLISRLSLQPAATLAKDASMDIDSKRLNDSGNTKIRDIIAKDGQYKNGDIIAGVPFPSNSCGHPFGKQAKQVRTDSVFAARDTKSSSVQSLVSRSSPEYLISPVSSPAATNLLDSRQTRSLSSAGQVT